MTATSVLQLVHRDYEPLLAGVRDTINVPLPPHLCTGGQFAEKFMPDQRPITQITLDKHMEASFQSHTWDTQDHMLWLSFDSCIKGLAESIDTHLIAAGKNGFAHSVDVNEDLELGIDTAETALFNAKAPRPWSILAGGEFFKRIWQHKRLSSKEQAIKGSGAYRSHHAVDSPLVFHHDALVFACRCPVPQPEATTSAYSEVAGGLGLLVSVRPGDLSMPIVTLECLYGVGVGRANFGVRLIVNQLVAA